MSSIKECPLCGTQRWSSDNRIVLEHQEFKTFTLFGYTIFDLNDALTYALSHGWRKEER